MHNDDSTVQVLIVDDDEGIQTLMKAIFGRYGVTAESVGDGTSALDRLRRHRYDAVVLDLMLPGPNGFDIIREIRSRDAAVLERTIVLTAASNATLRDFLNAGIVRRVVRKPFELDELVAEVLALTSRGAELNAAPVEPHTC